MFPSPHICLHLSVCTGDCWLDGPHMYAKTNVCVPSCLLAVCFSVGLEITLWTHTPIMMMSSLHMRLRLMMQRHFCLCLYYPQCTWKMMIEAGCFWLIGWLIRSSLSTVVCSAGQATCSGVDGDSGIGAEGQHVEGAGSGSAQTEAVNQSADSGQLHHSRVNCVKPELVSERIVHTDVFSCYRIKLWVYQQDVHIHHRPWVTWQTAGRVMCCYSGL